MGDRFGPGMQSRADDLAGRLSADELTKAERIASQWQPRPTALTEKASFGWDAESAYVKAIRD